MCESVHFECVGESVLIKQCVMCINSLNAISDACLQNIHAYIYPTKKKKFLRLGKNLITFFMKGFNNAILHSLCLKHCKWYKQSHSKLDCALKLNLGFKTTDPA